jgi:Holliday junction DNA helicase RuvA
MIEHLTGQILGKEEGRLVLDVGGVGYGLDIPDRTMEGIGNVGSRASLWVSTYVREEELKLFGFSSRGERDVFEVFLEISGIGPRLALAILSRVAIEELIGIVMRGDVEALKSIPGVGTKKAEKLLLELKGRVKRLSVGIEPATMAALAAADPSVGPSEIQTGAGRDAVAALEALEIPAVAARRAVARAIEILGPAADAEALVREGLRHRRG